MNPSFVKFIRVSLTWLPCGLALSGCALYPKSDADPSRAGHTEGHAVVQATQGQAQIVQPGVTEVQESEWQSMFDGESLTGWKATEFAGSGEIEIKDEEILLNQGVMLTGVSWTNDLPKTNYEVSLEAMKKDGTDFFCGLTFPVADSHCTFIVGGWGGGIVGISSIDSMDASENETTKYLNFKKDQWFHIRVRVTPAAIQAWIDDEVMVDQSIKDRKISMRPGEIEISAPFGIAAYQTTSALRNIRIRKIK